MKFAVIGDIHGNKYALESVLNDIDLKEIDFIVSTGDLVGYMPYPNEVIELVKKKKVIVVQGNHDKFIAESERITDSEIEKLSNEEIQSNASAAFTNWIISNDNRNYLNNLTNKLYLECSGKKISIVHGSPMKIDEYLYEDKENLSKISELINEDIIVCGHTHIPYHFEVNNKHFINAGSVGKPKHGDDRSTYIIVEVTDNTVKCEIEKVTYNVEKMIADIEDNPMISNKLIPMLKNGF